MNLAEFCLRRKTTTTVLAVVLFLAGLSSYFGMSRLEDPEFTIKDALVITPYPGAAPKEVEQEVTDEIEIAIQQLSQLDEMQSRSERGLSTVTVSIEDKYNAKTLPQVWDELRRKVNDAQGNLPPGAGPSIVIDDYGAVYGVYFVLYGDEFSYAELKQQADFLRRELLLVDDVARIEIHGNRPEAIYIEPIRDRLAQFDMAPEEFLNKLRQQNLVLDTGRARIGTEFIALDPTGEINSVEDFEELPFSHNQKKFYLRDFAKVHRAYVDPPSDIVRYNSSNAIALGISTVAGGNVVTMGEALDKRLAELKSDLPIGMEIGIISHQATSVTLAIDNFITSLLQALAIVIAVLLLFMGLRSGLLIGIILVLTIMGSFVFLKPMGVALERISLGALIIALGMLVDNAIVIVDGILVELKRGRSAFDGAVATVKQSAIPLLGATLIAIFAFAAIGTSDNAAGEFCSSLFRVIGVSLFLSWVTAVTVTPLLAVLMLKPPKEKSDGAKRAEPFNNRFYRIYKSLLRQCIRFRWVSVTLVIALFATSLWGFGFVKQAFFPPSTRAQYMVDIWLPQGTHIKSTRDEISKVEGWLQERQGVGNVTSLVGRGGLRFLLTYKPELPNSSYAQLLVDVEDASRIEEHIQATEDYIAETLPDAVGYGIKYELGPGGKGKIQARFLGDDPEVLRSLASQAEQIMHDHPNAKAIRTDWRQRVKLLRPELVEERANLMGIEKKELSEAIRQAYEGATVGVYREGDLLLPIIVRASDEERQEITQLENIQIWSPVARKRVPITQVISGVELVFEDEILMRLDRKPVISIFADPEEGTASALFKELQPQIEAIPLPEGYELLWYGEYKNSKDANEGLGKGIPMFALLMVLTTIALFNSLRQPLIIWLCVPLALIGVSAGLLITDQPFTFMALLGFISLSGMLLKNAIVMMDELNTQLSTGKEKLQAIVDSAASRLMPVAMAAATTILGMIPLFFDDFFAAMAVTIVFGLMFATVLTLVVLPVIYTIIFRIKPKEG
ncbi:efflux RND transporter permease subunit [Verrucomicrobiaceae bacterium N1E253]|uniref:Efflux RND transporter permease subunit n=1 Tax=Oceaniferula marina TaxID=2748318 RepID=A0A851GKW3_9BACT|nr:efflux RND transporter permease subunit [Oceaniferula marina]NWK55815.1 efflux RND transporter permease subunit [Oceaniferula marina]